MKKHNRYAALQLDRRRKRYVCHRCGSPICGKQNVCPKCRCKTR